MESKKFIMSNEDVGTITAVDNNNCQRTDPIANVCDNHVDDDDGDDDDVDDDDDDQPILRDRGTREVPNPPDESRTRIRYSQDLSGDPPKFLKDLQLWRIRVPQDSNCLFSAFLLAYLIVVKDDETELNKRLDDLYGQEMYDKFEARSIKTFVRKFNPFLNVNNFNNYEVRKLIELFRKRVIEHLSNRRYEYKEYMSDNAELYLSNIKNPDTWCSKVEVKAIDNLLKCTIQCGSYGDISNFNNDSGDKMTIKLMYDILDAGDQNEILYFNFCLANEAAMKIKVYSRLENFVKTFVDQFLELMQGYHILTKPKPLTLVKQPYTYTDEKDALEEGATIATRVICSGASGLMSPSKTYNYFQTRKDRKLGKKMNSLFHEFSSNKNNFTRMLVEISAEIFKRFEHQFTRYTAEGGVKRAMEKLARDAIIRIKDYVDQKFNVQGESKDETISSEPKKIITKGVIFGKSSSYHHLIHKIVKPGHTLKEEGINGKKHRTTAIFEDPGLAIKAKNGVVQYYRKIGTDSDEYGFRLLFEWESVKSERVNQNYRLITNNTEQQEYVIGVELERIVRDIQQEREDRDPANTNEIVERKVHEGIKESFAQFEIIMRSKDRTDFSLALSRDIVQVLGRLSNRMRLLNNGQNDEFGDMNNFQAVMDSRVCDDFNLQASTEEASADDFSTINPINVESDGLNANIDVSSQFKEEDVNFGQVLMEKEFDEQLPSSKTRGNRIETIVQTLLLRETINKNLMLTNERKVGRLLSVLKDIKKVAKYIMAMMSLSVDEKNNIMKRFLAENSTEHDLDSESGNSSPSIRTNPPAILKNESSIIHEVTKTEDNLENVVDSLLAKQEINGKILQMNDEKLENLVQFIKSMKKMSEFLSIKLLSNNYSRPYEQSADSKNEIENTYSASPINSVSQTDHKTSASEPNALLESSNLHAKKKPEYAETSGSNEFSELTDDVESNQSSQCSLGNDYEEVRSAGETISPSSEKGKNEVGISEKACPVLLCNNYVEPTGSMTFNLDATGIKCNLCRYMEANKEKIIHENKHSYNKIQVLLENAFDTAVFCTLCQEKIRDSQLSYHLSRDINKNLRSYYQKNFIKRKYAFTPLQSELWCILCLEKVGLSALDWHTQNEAHRKRLASVCNANCDYVWCPLCDEDVPIRHTSGHQRDPRHCQETKNTFMCPFCQKDRVGFEEVAKHFKKECLTPTAIELKAIMHDANRCTEAKSLIYQTPMFNSEQAGFGDFPRSKAKH